MKKSLLLSGFMLITAFSFAQTAFTVDHPDLTADKVFPGGGNIFFGSLNNPDTVSGINITIQILSTNIPAGWGVSFCNPNGCFGVGTLMNTFNISANDNAVTEVVFYTTGIPDTGWATIRYFDAANPGDYVDFDFQVSTTPAVGILATGESASSIKVFPNPASDYINYKTTVGEGITLLELIDMTGKTVITHQVQDNEDKIRIGNNLSPGNYLLKASNQVGAIIKVEKISIAKH